MPTVATLPVSYAVQFAVFLRQEPVRFAAGGEFLAGRVLVMADHSLFINDMMLQGDNDNIAFTFNVAHWLSDNGRRTKVLLYDDGMVQTDLNVRLEIPSPGLPPIEALVPLINRTLVEMERENIFNKFLIQATGPNWLRRTLLFAFTIGLLLYGMYRFLNSRFRSELRPRPALATASAPVPTLERRHQALMARGNLAEAAHELAYQAFAALGVDVAADSARRAVVHIGPWWQRAAAHRITFFRLGHYRLALAGSWWQREVWLRRVWRLWQVATRKTNVVSPRRLQRLVAALRDLQSAVSDGKVAFSPAQAT